MSKEKMQRKVPSPGCRPAASGSRISTRRFIASLLTECSEKHSLHPLESNLSLAYHVELTFTVQEIRELLIENGDCWDWRKYFDSENDQAQATPASAPII